MFGEIRALKRFVAAWSVFDRRRIILTGHSRNASLEIFCCVWCQSTTYSFASLSNRKLKDCAELVMKYQPMRYKINRDIEPHTAEALGEKMKQLERRRAFFNSSEVITELCWVARVPPVLVTTFITLPRVWLADLNSLSLTISLFWPKSCKCRFNADCKFLKCS